MAQAELPRPGVEVIQEFRTVSPTIVAPTLVPCVVGVCNQVVEVLNADGTLNSDALLAGAAIALAPTAGSYDLDGKTLQVSVNGGPIQVFTFSGNALTAGQVANQITASNPAPANFAAYSWSDGAVSPSYHLQLRSLATGEDRSIRIVGGSALSDFGWSAGYTYYGLGSYVQDEITVPQSQLPDPRSNIDELDFDEDSLRAFVDLGTEVREFVRTEAFLRKGSSIAIYDDTDGDNTTPFVDLSENLLAPPTSALKLTTGVDFTSPVDIHNKTLILQIDGSGKQTITLLGQPIVSDDSTGWTFASISADMDFNVNGTTITVPFDGTQADIDDVVDLINATSVADVGVNIAYRCDQYGLENGSGDYVGLYYGAAPSTSTTANAFVSIPAQAANASMTEMYTVDTEIKQMNWGAKPHVNWPIGGIEDQIDDVFGVTVADIDASNNLKLESSADGAESKIEIDEGSTALTDLGFVTPFVVTGGPFAVRVGDDLYGNGGLLGTILEIHSGGTQGRLKLETEVAITGTWATWYIIAKNLDTVDSDEYGASVPMPDMFVDTSGNIVIKHDVLRDTTGEPVVSASVSMYIAYTALRLDVTPEAAEPSLLSFDNVDDLEDALGPLNTDNPLGYGLYLCLANAGAVTVSGIGVSEKSADKPYGTVVGYSKVWDFLEAKEVYAIAVLTTDLEVALTAKVHVDSMSAPENKGERIVVTHLGTPLRKSDVIVASGTDGDYLVGPPDFDTKLTTLSQALLALGIDPTNISTDDGVYIDLASDALRWNIGGGSSVADGTKVAINTTFSAGQNDDAYYSEGTFPDDLISETFSIMVRGALVANKQEEIDTIVARGSSFLDRRVWMPQLGRLRATVDGVESSIPGFYFAAAKAGMVSGNPPQTPLTNYPVAGFIGVTDTNDRYKESLLNQGAAGGAEWIIQEADGVPIQSRHQLTTNMTSIETREQSIVKAIDFSAKFMRIGLRNFIGRYNITPNFLDTLSAVVQGQLKWLMDHKVIREGDLNNILQDETNPDTVLIDVTIVPMYPCNYIRLTIII